MADPRRWAWLCIVAVAVVLAIGFRVNPLNTVAQGHASTVAATSAATYVSLRAVNAFLSTAQEVEVGGSLVVSGTAQPLKILEPIDDTVERIASVVFALMVVAGVLAVSLGPIGAVGWAMIAGAGLLALFGRDKRTLSELAAKLGSYGAFIGLGLPLAFVLSAGLGEIMTAEVYDRHSAVIADLTQTLGSGDLVETAGLWTDLNRYRELASAIYLSADTLIESYISLVAVCVFRLFVLPLMLLGAILLLARHFARS